MKDYNRTPQIVNYLEREDIELPNLWRFEDEELKRFSEKNLFNYQVSALKNFLKFLYIYYEKSGKNKEDTIELNKEIKKVYDNFEIDEKYFNDLEIDESNKSNLFEIADNYYQAENNKINYVNFLNRCSFWMATGSGKTLLIVKLIYLLDNLMERGLIPERNILFLTYNDNLLDNFKKYINEFNKYSNIKINVESLKRFLGGQTKLGERTSINVYSYESTNIVDESGKVQLDFKRYENNGKWYIILDEAHKGEKGKSKSQLIYSIMSRNGFLFNFSATFTNKSDIATTIYNISFPEYIKQGYGKIIVPLETIKGFKRKEKGNEHEHIRNRQILESLIVLSVLKEAYLKLRKEAQVYHKPLLVMYTNTVNINEEKKDSDLFNIFTSLLYIIKPEKKNDINNLLEEAKKDLKEKLKDKDCKEHIIPNLQNEQIKEEFNYDTFSNYMINLIDNINYDTILKNVYNSKYPSSIEFIMLEGKEDGEIALNLKTAGIGKPFALIKIGNTKGWKDYLINQGYEFNKTPVDINFFNKLNAEESEINILLGSRTFFEGWDSNRPNIITFINIGSKEARKYVLQAIGRGLRIEPVKGYRRRLMFNTDKIKLNDIESALLLEKLFVSATNLDATTYILENLESLSSSEGIPIGENFEKNEEIKNKAIMLLAPKYKIKTINDEYLKQIIQKELSNIDLENLQSFISWLNLNDENTYKILAMNTNSYFDFNVLNKISNILNKIDIINNKYIDNENEKYFSKPRFYYPELILSKTISIINDTEQHSEEIDKFYPVYEDDIQHFKKIKVYIGFYNGKEIKKENVNEIVKSINNFKGTNKNVDDSIIEFDLELYKFIKHYYNPLLIPKDESTSIDFVSHIIQEKSELKFIYSLKKMIIDNKEEYEKEYGKHFEYWYFSRLEPIDNIYIRYFNQETATQQRFIPDFIFWFKKGNKYVILFADPKSIEFRQPEDKLEGFKELFMEGDKLKIFEYKTPKNEEYKVVVDLKFLNDKNINKPFWIKNDAESLFKVAKELIDME